jgi:hypothetical protein
MTRKNTDNNGFEFLCAILLTFPDIQNKEELFEIVNNSVDVNKKIEFNRNTDLDNYKLDLTTKPEKCDNYITKFRNQFSKMNIDYDTIVKVYLTGKSNNISIIEELNKGINRKQAKADLYIEIDVRIKTNLNKRFIGLSVKQDKAATKSNYSVEKILGFIDKKYLTELREIRRKYLKDNDISDDDCINNKDKVNSLFYPDKKDNPYWNKMKEYLDLHNKYVCKFLCDNLFPYELPYPLYEFNGETFVKLNKNISEMKLEHCEDFYYKINNDVREAAKLFYRLFIEFEDKTTKEIRLEIRFKNPINGPSPQFQPHEISTT